MTVLVDATFATDAEGFSAGSRVAAEGADYATGFLQVGAGQSSVKSFTAQTSGKVRLDFAYRSTDTTVDDTGNSNHLILLLPTSGDSTSANSLAAVALTRVTSIGASTTNLPVQYRNGGSFATFVGTQFIKRNQWRRLSVVVDFDAKTYDLYLQGYLRIRGATCPNASASDVSRIAIVGSASAPNSDFDLVRLEAGWTIEAGDIVSVTDDFTVGTGTIGSSTPASDNRELSLQKWISPPNTTVGKFTRSANGLVAEASKSSYCFTRTGSEGIWEATFTAATSGNVYGGIMFNAYEGASSGLGTEDANWAFRYASGSANRVVLFQGSTSIASTTTLTGTSISAGSTYTIKIVRRGSFIWCYINNVLQLSGPHNDATSGGARGLSGEEWAGILFASSLGTLTNYCTNFTYTGPGPNYSLTKTSGPLTVTFNEGGIRDLYHSGFGDPDANLFVGKGIQLGHPPEGELGADRASLNQVMIDTANCRSLRQRGQFYKTTENTGYGDVSMTVLRSRIVCDDRCILTGSRQFGPDFDLRADLFRAAGAKYVGSSGSVVDVAMSTFHNWTTRISSGLPHASQFLGDNGSGNKIRITMAARNNAGLSGTIITTTKHKGNPDPISTVIAKTSNADDATLSFGMHYLIETGASLALDNTILTDYRDDIATPATLTLTTGTLKTDSPGDANTDGFNERHWWHEINAVADAIDITNDSVKRIKPAFRIHGLSSGTCDVVVDSVSLTQNTDYWVDDLGDGSHLLQLDGNLLASESLQLEVASAGTVVTPDSASLSLATFAPTVTASENQSVTPSTAALTLTTFAPDVLATANRVVTPGSATLSLNSFAPTASTSDELVVVPGTAILNLTKSPAPDVLITDNVLVTPGLATLILAAFEPSVLTDSNVVVTPATATLALTTFRPNLGGLNLPPSYLYYFQMR
jgi:hypothetical protein